jgi:predicted kinase
VRYHQMPFFLIERPDAQRLAAEISLTSRCDLLALVATADIRGRVCADMQRVLGNIELYGEYCRDEGCYSGPRQFASAHTRYLYFRSDGRHPDVLAHNDTKVDVVLMSGLPGSGKDTYVQMHYRGWPVVSLDGLREELDIDAADNQGAVIQAARDRAKSYLRKGERFVWNATNISKRFRAPLLGLLHDYGARSKIVYIESSRDTLWTQNRQREAAVPEQAIRSMQSRWEPPDLTEAHEVEYVVDGTALAAPSR